MTRASGSGDLEAAAAARRGWRAALCSSSQRKATLLLRRHVHSASVSYQQHAPALDEYEDQ